MVASPVIRIGVSGWTYKGWRGVFYPAGLPHRQELEFAGSSFDTIEINGSFYSLQTPASFRRWRAETPDDFVFAVKGSRFITHNKKLRNAETALANFFASGVLLLGEKLGPFLWQISSSLRFDAERMDAFFGMLPATTHAAAELARGHDHRVEGRSWTEPGRRRRLRHAIEPRHESFFVPEFAEICRRHGVAIVFSESADWVYTEEVTADFVYLRLHGSQETYSSRYEDEELDRWADRIRAWSTGGEPTNAQTFSGRKPARRKKRDVYVYFDNDAKVHAPSDAMRLRSRLDAR